MKLYEWIFLPVLFPLALMRKAKYWICYLAGGHVFVERYERTYCPRCGRTKESWSRGEYPTFFKKREATEEMLRLRQIERQQKERERWETQD